MSDRQSHNLAAAVLIDAMVVRGVLVPAERKEPREPKPVPA
jgi:hypothetical protein